VSISFQRREISHLEFSLVDPGEYPYKFRFVALEGPYRGATIPDHGHLCAKDGKTQLKMSYHYPDIQHSPLNSHWLASCNTPCCSQFRPRVTHLGLLFCNLSVRTGDKDFQRIFVSIEGTKTENTHNR
jgi:hypothetical protein